MEDKTFIGWSVAVAIWRDSRLLARAFAVGTFDKDDAERYARDEVEKDYPPAEGWMIVVASMPMYL